MTTRFAVLFNQCDLANRKIKLSELAYGTEKARNLFQDMMVEANEQFGFLTMITHR